MQNKEKPRLAKKRKEYLDTKREWEEKIAQRNIEIAEWHAYHTMDSEFAYGPLYECPPKLMFVYLDESYVNRNHSLGYTWYDPDDEHGAAVFMATGSLIAPPPTSDTLTPPPSMYRKGRAPGDVNSDY